jgi:CheY-like chemotaxis protein
LIEDDPDVTLTLKTVLENGGYTVDTFNDPVIALKNFKKVIVGGEGGGTYYYGFVLTDIRTPTMNGFELY